MNSTCLFTNNNNNNSSVLSASDAELLFRNQGLLKSCDSAAASSTSLLVQMAKVATAAQSSRIALPTLPSLNSQQDNQQQQIQLQQQRQQQRDRSLSVISQDELMAAIGNPMDDLFEPVPLSNNGNSLFGNLTSSSPTSLQEQQLRSDAMGAFLDLALDQIETTVPEESTSATTPTKDALSNNIFPLQASSTNLLNASSLSGLGSLKRPLPWNAASSSSSFTSEQQQPEWKRRRCMTLPTTTTVSSNVVRNGKNSTTASSLLSEESTPRFRPYQQKQWEEQFQELLAFKAKHGNCCVPHTFEENPILSRWVKRQRYQYKLRQEGKPSTMTANRIVELEQVGFVWDSHAAAWEERLSELRLFMANTGHCNVPSTYPENPRLATWVKCQRRQYKLFRNGSSSNINSERIEKLNQMGFLWEVRGIHPSSSNSSNNQKSSSTNNTTTNKNNKKMDGQAQAQHQQQQYPFLQPMPSRSMLTPLSAVNMTALLASNGTPIPSFVNSMNPMTTSSMLSSLPSSAPSFGVGR